MEITVRFFASTRDAVGAGAINLTFDGDLTAAELLDRLIVDYPRIAGFRGTGKVAVNTEFRPVDWQLQDGDEVCLIPPVSGG